MLAGLRCNGPWPCSNVAPPPGHQYSDGRQSPCSLIAQPGPAETLREWARAIYRLGVAGVPVTAGDGTVFYGGIAGEDLQFTLIVDSSHAVVPSMVDAQVIGDAVEKSADAADLGDFAVHQADEGLARFLVVSRRFIRGGSTAGVRQGNGDKAGRGCDCQGAGMAGRRFRGNG